MNHRLVLLTGGTGYVGGRLLKKLEALGVATRCLARRPEHLRGRIGPAVEVVAGDVMDSDSLAAAAASVHTAYYLIHSMGSAGSFEEQDRLGAQNFGQAARAAGVQRIVYLGGLGDEQQSLSPHLRSRHEVGDILRASGVPVIEFRASIMTTWIVALPMLVEAVTSAALVWQPPSQDLELACWGGVSMVIVIWVSTAVLQVPRHKALAIGFDSKAHRGLVLSNWIRTVAWSMRGVLVLFLLNQTLARGLRNGH